jgi:hypothetical protein
MGSNEFPAQQTSPEAPSPAIPELRENQSKPRMSFAHIGAADSSLLESPAGHIKKGVPTLQPAHPRFQKKTH